MGSDHQRNDYIIQCTTQIKAIFGRTICIYKIKTKTYEICDLHPQRSPKKGSAIRSHFERSSASRQISDSCHNTAINIGMHNKTQQTDFVTAPSGVESPTTHGAVEQIQFYSPPWRCRLERLSKQYLICLVLNLSTGSLMLVKL